MPYIHFEIDQVKLETFMLLVTFYD